MTRRIPSSAQWMDFPSVSAIRGEKGDTGDINVDLPAEGRTVATLTDYLANNAVFNVLDFGADRTAATDSTAAFQACAAAANASVATRESAIFEIPPGKYDVRDTIEITSHRVHVRGAGRKWSSVIYFGPASAKACFKLQRAVTSEVLYQGSVTGILFSGNIAGIQKIAIDAYGISEYYIADCATNNWNGNSGSASTPSIALRLNGHELNTIEICDFYADRPVHIKESTITANGLDTTTFRDMYYGADGPEAEDCILIDPAVVMTNISFEGYQSFVKGRDGVRWLNSGAAYSTNIKFNNIKREQTGATQRATAYAVNITGFIRTLSFDQCSSDSLANGFKALLQAASDVTLTNSRHEGGAGTTGLNVTANSFAGINNFFQTGCSITTSGMEHVFSLNPGTDEALAFPRVAFYATTAETSKSITTYGQRTAYLSGSLANDTSVTIPAILDAAAYGVMEVEAHNSTHSFTAKGEVILKGGVAFDASTTAGLEKTAGNAQVALSNVTDATGQGVGMAAGRANGNGTVGFTATAMNVNWDNGFRWTLVNKSGVTVTYGIQIRGAV